MAPARRSNTRKPWTPEDTEALRRLIAARNPPRGIAGQLGRSIEAVAKQAAKISLKLGPHQR